MLDVIATDADDLYFTSDTHFNHGNIIKYCHRPFLGPLDRSELEWQGGRWHDGSWKGSKESKWKITPEGIKIMNDTLLQEINSLVPSDAVLIHVGDFSMLPKSEDRRPDYVRACEEFRSRINCKRVYIIWGNHDNQHLIKYLFQWSGERAKVNLNKLGIDIICDHYMGGVWDCSHRAALQVYGHSHADIENGAEKALPGRRNMDVGVDNAAKLLGAYRPFRLREILDHLLRKPGVSFNPHIPQHYHGPREGAD
jgi:calcineurin-like phosphoesterase family protein